MIYIPQVETAEGQERQNRSEMVVFARLSFPAVG